MDARRSRPIQTRALLWFTGGYCCLLTCMMAGSALCSLQTIQGMCSPSHSNLLVRIHGESSQRTFRCVKACLRQERGKCGEYQSRVVRSAFDTGEEDFPDGARVAPRSQQNRKKSKRSKARSFDEDEQPTAEELERRALAAADAWDNDLTVFLEPTLADEVERRLARLNVACIRIGGYAEAQRVRLLFTHPDILEASGAEALADEQSEKAVLVRITGEFDTSDPLPNLLAKIGIASSQLGDLLLDDEVAYLVLPVDRVKTVQRLLPKELDGVVTVEVLEPGTAPDGELVDLEVTRVDKRKRGGGRRQR